MKKIMPLLLALGLGITGCAHKAGVEVSQEKATSLRPGITKKDDVIKSLGHPMRKEQVGKTETWYYDYTEINAFGDNVSESTVLEFDSKGVLRQKYKTGKAKGNNKNPLLDAAGL